MVMEGDSHSKGRVFESQHRILDGNFSQYIAINMKCLFEKIENKQKRGRVLPIFKKQILV